uniref:Uncharacterized protein n=1 Tax=Poecilia formosa TaxID=48698 RepID=A0A096LVJ5_POEFO
LARRRQKRKNCLMGCCNPDLDEPTTCHSQTDDEDFILEKPLGYMPLHHELDSGLGWTDGSLHQGDLSGLETEEGGLEDCHPHGNFATAGCGGFGGGGSPSSESFISSELSDSGFYSVSTGEFRHFQRLLEKRMRLYNARMQHQGEPCERRERRDSCPKSHRELLESIPEALTMQPPCQHLQNGMEDGAGPVMDVQPRGLFRVSSVQFHKADRPCLNRHSSSSGALFNPSHTAVPRINAPVLSTCSTPSSHRRPQIPMQQQYNHQGSSSVGMLRRSRTLHHRPPPQEYRRRASHPASPSYCAATLHYCGGVTPHNVLPPGLPEEGELDAGVMASHPTGMALSPQQHPAALGHHLNLPLPMRGAGINTSSPSYPDRYAGHYYGHLSLPQDHCDGGRYSYMSSSPRDTVEINHQTKRGMHMYSCESHGNHLKPHTAQHKVSDFKAIDLSAYHTITPSSHRRPQIPMQQQYNHQGSSSVGMLRRSRTLHHRPPPQEYRRRASHPASPSYCAATLHYCGGVTPHNVLPPGLPEEGELDAGVMASHPTGMALSPQQHPAALGHEEKERERQLELERSRAREQQHLQSHVLPLQAGDVNDTWPKPASRQSYGGGGGRGLYSTLEGHTGVGTSAECEAKPNPSSRPNTTSRVTRSQLLRDRAHQLADERSGMSTDEENNTDMLLGRYWSRTERREHFLLAREQKQSRGVGPFAEGRCKTVLELSQRKLSRLRNRKLLDDWTTVEELLTHGTRLDNQEDMLCPSSLLTVTTV